MRETPFNIEPWEINVKELKNLVGLQIRFSRKEGNRG